jgi:hypothetical protein
MRHALNPEPNDHTNNLRHTATSHDGRDHATGLPPAESTFQKIASSGSSAAVADRRCCRAVPRWPVPDAA